MNRRLIVAATAVLLMTPLGGAMAAGAFTALHPEEAYPNPTEQPSPDLYTGFVSKVQEKLRELGFDAGPVNGDFGAKTQAALAQFQLSRTIPASGQLDGQTLAELGVRRDDPQDSAVASTGSTTAPVPASAGDPATVTSPAGSSSERTAEPKPPGQTVHQPEPKTGEKPGG
jgi:peptidoglycan hydrolase-like protein with peptidoglycan-binding domain